MDDIAAADNEHSFPAKGRELLSRFRMEPGRLPLINAQLYDWNIGIGKYAAQYRPGSVIEPTLAVEIDWDLRKQIFDALCQVRTAGSGISDSKQLFREAAKVVNCPGRGHRGHHYHKSSLESFQPCSVSYSGVLPSRADL